VLIMKEKVMKVSVKSYNNTKNNKPTVRNRMLPNNGGFWMCLELKYIQNEKKPTKGKLMGPVKNVTSF